MNDYAIMLIRVNQRLHQAEKLQKVLSGYGCCIKTRLGLHEAGDVLRCRRTDHLAAGPRH